MPGAVVAAVGVGVSEIVKSTRKTGSLAAPSAVTRDDSRIQTAQKDAKKRQRLRRGRAGSILTGSRGVSDAGGRLGATPTARAENSLLG